jgi:acetyltransferase-like isoleucine patch superfamily enzyme
MLRKKINKFLKSDIRGAIFTYIYVKRVIFSTLISNKLVHLICYLKGVTLGKDVTFNGIPNIYRHSDSSIIIGDKCKFNSAKNSVILGLHHPCSLVTLRAGAEISFGNNSGGSGIRIAARTKITIGNNVLIGSNCTIIDNDFHHPNHRIRKPGFDNIPAKPITIEDDVFIGFNTIILKGVRIGKNSVIGANSVVFNDIAEDSIATGNPCKLIMKKKIT